MVMSMRGPSAIRWTLHGLPQPRSFRYARSRRRPQAQRNRNSLTGHGRQEASGAVLAGRGGLYLTAANARVRGFVRVCGAFPE